MTVKLILIILVWLGINFIYKLINIIRKIKVKNQFILIPGYINNAYDFPSFLSSSDESLAKHRILFGIGFTQHAFTVRCNNYRSRFKLYNLIKKPFKNKDEYFKLIRMTDYFCFKRADGYLFVYDSRDDFIYQWDEFINKIDWMKKAKKKF